MMLWCSLPRLRLAVAVSSVVCFTVRSFAEQRLLCSSSFLSMWYEYEEFTMVQVGWHMSIVYKNNTWVEESRALSPCEDFRICDVIKGETIHETFPVSIKAYLIPDGEYRLLLTVNIIDEFNMELTLRGKLTVHVRNER